MGAEHVAEATELGLAGVGGAEFEGCGGSGVVDEGEAGVGFEDVEDGTVDLPEELWEGGVRRG